MAGLDAEQVGLQENGPEPQSLSVNDEPRSRSLKLSIRSTNPIINFR